MTVAVCPNCGFGARWIPESNAWGCDRCRQLVQPVMQAQMQPPMMQPPMMQPQMPPQMQPPQKQPPQMHPPQMLQLMQPPMMMQQQMQPPQTQPRAQPAMAQPGAKNGRAGFVIAGVLVVLGAGIALAVVE